MLEHGADPHECFIQGPASILRPATGSLRRPRVGIMRKGFDEERWTAENPHTYFHSVTAVAKDAFATKFYSKTEELLILLEREKVLGGDIRIRRMLGILVTTAAAAHKGQIGYHDGKTSFADIVT